MAQPKVVDEDLTTVSIDAPVVGQHNAYLVTQTNQLRSRTIPWEVSADARYCHLEN